MNPKIIATVLLLLGIGLVPSELGHSHHFPATDETWRSLVPGPGITPSDATKDTILSTVGLDWDRLKSAWDFTQGFGGGGSMIVIRDDWIAFESSGTQVVTSAASVTKSLLGLAAARLFDLSTAGKLDRHISPESFAADFLPPTWNKGDPRRGGARIRHLLTMTSGIEPWDDPNDPAYDEDFILDREFMSPPGSVWAYCSLSPDLASIALQNASGLSIASLLDRDVLGPIGADVVWAQIEGSHSTKASTDARMSTRSLARIASLLLHNGEWAGQQLVSRKNIALITRWAAQLQAVPFAATPDSPFVVPSHSPQHYGYLYWTNVTGEGLGPETPADAYFAHGFGEDLMIVIPSLHLIVVRMGHGPKGQSAEGFRQEFMRLVMLAVNIDLPTHSP